MVLSNNDGCVVSRSNEAKKLGIKMGEPLFKIMNIIEREKVAVFSSNYILYGDMSKRVMDCISNFIPAMEIYSIDEAFMDFTGIENSKIKRMGEEIARITHKNTGIPISIGISHTKTLAKVAKQTKQKIPKTTKLLFYGKRAGYKKGFKYFSH